MSGTLGSPWVTWLRPLALDASTANLVVEGLWHPEIGVRLHLFEGVMETQPAVGSGEDGAPRARGALLSQWRAGCHGPPVVLGGAELSDRRLLPLIPLTPRPRRRYVALSQPPSTRLEVTDMPKNPATAMSVGFVCLPLGVTV